MPEAASAPAGEPFRGVVAIDGPSGSGKSTVARELAMRLDARYLDTGAMYRAVTWAVQQAGVRPDDALAVTGIAETSKLAVCTDARAPGISVNDQRVDTEIRSAAVTRAVSAVSATPGVRDVLVHEQRQLIGTGGIVVEGRDIGAVVAPEADVKVYLTASTGARADRRGTEMGTTAPAELAATAADLSRRDRLDSTRALDPLVPAPDAVLLDTTDLGIAEVVARLLELVEKAVGTTGTWPGT